MVENNKKKLLLEKNNFFFVEDDFNQPLSIPALGIKSTVQNSKDVLQKVKKEGNEESGK